MDTYLLAGTLYWGLYRVGSLRLQQGQPNAVPISLSTLLSPSGTESRRRVGGQEEAPSVSNGGAPYGDNGRDPYKPKSSYPYGDKGISN